MIYKKVPSTTPTHFTEGTQLLSGAAGVKQVMYNYYKTLATKMSDTANIARDLRKFTHPRVTDDTRKDKIRETVSRMSASITAHIDITTVIKAITGAGNKAANPNDEVDIRTLKEIIKLTKLNSKPEDTQGIACELHSNQILGNIVDLFNTVLQHKHFPPSMNNGVICPLFKDGDSADMANYRPITLLPVLYKILTKIINDRMMHVLDESQAVSGIQAGLGGGMNCHTQVNTMLNVMRGATLTCHKCDYRI